MKQTALICDLDGTLSLLNGRDPYDASTCEDDLISEPVKAILDQFSFDCYESNPPHSPFIILVSGRFDTFQKQTEKWLKKHRVFYDRLYMRRAGDMRKDTIVKKEIYQEHIEPYYDVLFAIDDRPQVCRMWRQELGIFVLQVNDVEF